MILYNDLERLIKNYNYPFTTVDNKHYKSITVVRDLNISTPNNKLLLVLFQKESNTLKVLLENISGVGYRELDLNDLSEEKFNQILESLPKIVCLTDNEYLKKVKEIKDRFVSIARAVLGPEDENEESSICYFNTDLTLPVLIIYTGKDNYSGIFSYFKYSEDSGMEMVTSSYLGLTDEEFFNICKEASNYRNKKDSDFFKLREKG